MKLTKAVLLLLFKCLIFELVTSELSTKDEDKQLTCTLKMCTDTLKDLGAMEAQLKALVNSQQVLMSRLADSEARIEEIKREIQDTPKVAFSASFGSDGLFGPFGIDTTLVYKNVFINVGDAYNQATGIFTAPVRGVYYFSFFYHCSTKHETQLALVRNGKFEAVTRHHKSEGSAENGGNGLTLLLEKGDQVYIVLTKNAWIWDSYSVTVFSGFLINAM